MVAEHADRPTRTTTRGTTIALVALTLTASACNGGLPDIDSTPARAALDDATGDAADEATTCPIADSASLIEQAFSLVDDESSRAALEEGEPYTTVRTIGTTDVVECGRSAGDPLAVGIAIGPGDPSIDDHITRISEPGPVAEDDVEVDVIERAEHRGGRVARLCLEHEDDPSLDLCEVVWTDDSVFVSAFARGGDATDVALAAVEERFVPVVQLVLEAFAEA